MKEYTEVAAALIWDGDRFLVCRRPPHKARGLLWEFVGGKAEAGEALQQTLVRECMEELGVTVEPGEVFMQVLHDYPDISIRLTVFHAKIVSGQPQLLEHAAMEWITVQEIENYEFCPADTDILQRLREQYS